MTSSYDRFIGNLKRRRPSSSHDAESQFEMCSPPQAPKISRSDKKLKILREKCVSDDLKYELKLLIKYLNCNIDILEVECSSIEYVMKALRSEEIQKIVDKSKLKVISLVFKIENGFSEKDFKNLHMIKTKEDQYEMRENNEIRMDTSKSILFEGSKAMLIAFESDITGESRIYFKASRGEDFKCLNLMDYQNMGQVLCNKLTAFIINFLVKQLHAECTGLLTLENSANLKNVSIEMIGDLMNNNLLMIAIEEDVSMVDILLPLQVDINHISEGGQTAASIAWDEENYDVLLKLLEANSRFPENFDIKKVCNYPKIMAFVKIHEELHQAIQDEDFNKIYAIIKSKKELTYFYSVSNISAAYYALQNRKFKVYKKLADRHVFTCPLEKTEDVTEKFNEEEQKSLLIFHDGVTKNFDDEHLLTLRSNSKIVHDDQNLESRREAIKKVFEYLNTISLIRILLIFIAKSRKFKIVFDFKREHVNFFDPTLGSCPTRGVYCESGNIYVAAKDFLHESTRMKGYGTLIHELTHYAMNLAYSNKCKPYQVGSDKEIKFDGITIMCRTSVMKEDDNEVPNETIKAVFDVYKKRSFHSELIARVPQLIVMFDKNQMDDFKDKFGPLYDFFVDATNDIKTKIPCEKMKGDKYIEKYHEMTKRQKKKVKTLSRWVCVLSILGIILLMGIGVITTWYLNEIYATCNNCTWNDLSQWQKENAKSQLVNFQGAQIPFGDLIEHNETIAQMLNSGDIYNIRFNTSNFFVGENLVQKFNKNYCGIDTRFHKNLILDFNEDMTLITGEAGTGKSTTLEKAIFDIKSNPNSYDARKWIIFIKFADFNTLMKENNFDNHQIKDLLMNFISFKSTIDQEIFMEKLKKQKILIFWDAFDELKSNNEEKAVEIIKDFRTHKISQIITSRHTKSNGIDKIFNKTPHTIQPLNKEESIELANCMVNLKKIKFRIVDEERIKNITKSLDDVITRSSKNNRLLISMIVELMLRKTNQNEQIDSYYSIYDSLTHEKLENPPGACDNFRIVTQIDTDSKDCHYYVALKDIFGGISFDIINQNYVNAQDAPFLKEEASLNFFNITGDQTFEQLSTVKKYQLNSTKCEKMTLYDIMNYNSNGDLTFPHHTYAEFFVAQFITKKISEDSQEDSNLILRMLAFVATHDKFEFIQKLMIESMKDQKVNSKIVPNLGDVFEKLNYQQDEMKLLSRLFVSDDNTLNTIWKVNQSETAFNAFLRHNFNSKNLSLKSTEIYEIARECFTNATELTHGVNQDLGVLSIVWYQADLTVGETLLDITNMSQYSSHVDKILKLTTFTDFYNYTKNLIPKENRDEILREFYKNYFIIAFSMFVDTKPDSELLFNDIETLFTEDEITALFSQKSLSNSTLLYEFVYLNSDIEYLNMILSHLEKVIKSPDALKDLILLQESNTNSTTLMRVTHHGLDVAILQNYWNFTKKYVNGEDLEEHLKTQNYYHFTALHLSAWNKNEGFFKETVKIYEETFNNNKSALKEIMFTDRTTTNKLFIRSLVNKSKKNICEEVMEYLENLYEDEIDLKFTESGETNRKTWCDNNLNIQPE